MGTSNANTEIYEFNRLNLHLSDAIHFATNPDPVFGLYTNNASAPLRAAAGLRQVYKFGIYSHCAYVNDTAGQCGNQTIGEQFKPYDALTSDMNGNWSIFTQSFIPDTGTFRNSGFLGHNSKAAYWMLLLGMLCGAAAFITYVLVSLNRLGFLFLGEGLIRSTGE